MILPTLAVLVLGFITVRRGADRSVAQHRQGRWFLFVGVGLLALLTVFWFFFGIGEMAGGDFSGAIHLVPGVMTLLLLVFTLRRPVEAAWVLPILGSGIAAYFILENLMHLRTGMQAALISGAPYLLAGLFVVAGAVWARTN